MGDFGWLRRGDDDQWRFTSLAERIPDVSLPLPPIWTMHSSPDGI